MEITLLLLLFGAVGILALIGVLCVGVILYFRSRSPDDAQYADDQGHVASATAQYVAPENPYHAPAASGGRTTRKSPPWVLVAVITVCGLFVLLACGGAGLLFVSAKRQASQFQMEAMQAEQQARQAAEEARRVQAELEALQNDN